MVGSDTFLINKAVELILSAAKINPLDVNHVEEGATLAQINAAVQNVSMFGANPAVLLRLNGDVRLHLSQIASEKALEKVDCNPMSADLVTRMIMQNKKFPMASATALARICENNFTAINNEMEKLDAYYCDQNQITEDQINAIVTKPESYQIYELSNAILRREVAKINHVLETLTSAGAEDYAIFGSLLSFARRIFYATNLKKPDAEIAKFLGVAPYAITATRRDARHINAERATEIYNNALKLEYEIKSGKLYANRAVTLLVGAFA